MLYYLLYQVLYPMASEYRWLSVLNVTNYGTFRTAAASLSAFAIGLALGPWMIRKLRKFQIGQVIRQEGPTSHRAKSGTPTMGGLLILTAAIVPTLLWANLTNEYVWIAVGTTAPANSVALRWLAFGSDGLTRRLDCLGGRSGPICGRLRRSRSLPHSFSHQHRLDAHSTARAGGP